jgi:hypothetical protein
VSEQETRQSKLLEELPKKLAEDKSLKNLERSSSETARSKTCKKLGENFFVPQGAENPGSLACGIFAALEISRGVASRRCFGKRGLPFSKKTLLFLFAAQEFVALDGGNYANGAFIARFRALDAAEAAYAHGTRQGDLVRQGQKNFNR